MYRLVIFCVILNIAFGCRRCPQEPSKWRKCQNYKYRPPIDDKPKPVLNTFDSIAKDIIDADEKQNQLCQKYSKNQVKEMFGRGTYSLFYKLTGVKENDLAIRIKHRVIEVKTKDFEDIRVFPEMVDATQAQWDFEDGVLEILAPYKNIKYNKEIDITCSNKANDKERPMPRYEEDIDPRFQDDASVTNSTITNEVTTPNPNKDVTLWDMLAHDAGMTTLNREKLFSNTNETSEDVANSDTTVNPNLLVTANDSALNAFHDTDDISLESNITENDAFLEVFGDAAFKDETTTLDPDRIVFG